LGITTALRERAQALIREIRALAMAARDPRVPWLARLLVVAVVAYALSPVDLIPDFVPVLGYLDDLILLPAGIALAIRLVPDEVMRECRARAREANPAPLSGGRLAGAVIVLVWIALGVAGAAWLWHVFVAPAGRWPA
jgi:uncharacterized membrane protein YkvA (DUF1232 family)